MQRIFITGASGMLGATCVALAAARFKVTACHGRHSIRWPGVNSVGMDLTDERALYRTLDENRPDVIVHLAAATNLERCEREPEYAARINVEVTRSIGSWSAAHGTTCVYMSTDSVFDGKGSRYTEADTPSPQNVYAKSKLDGELGLRETGCSHLIVRSNIFGWNAQPKMNLAEWILDRLNRGETVPGYSNVVFNPLTVGTLSERILRLVESPVRGLIHLGTAEPLSKFEFARRLAQTFGHNPDRVAPTNLLDAQSSLKRPLNTCLSTCRSDGIPIYGAWPTIDEEITLFKKALSSGLVAKLKASIQSYEHP